MTPILNIVIPMAGAGSRFAKEGYQDPKPLIPVKGVPMIRLVIENLRPLRPHKFVFICQRSHNKEYGLAIKLQAWAPGSVLIETDGLTEGAACTVLLAEKEINNSNPLMIANSDQFVEVDINDYLQSLDTAHNDGLIMTMPAADPKWSFVKMNSDNLVTEVVEKKVISNEATVGVYNFKRGSDFVKAAKKMIAEDKRVNNEFYVAPTYNELINSGAKIGIFNIGENMHGIGTPDDLNQFLKLPVSERAVRNIL